jgi:hypothetical protein
MARKSTVTTVRSASSETAPALPVGPVQLSAKLTAVIDNLRRPFKAFVSEFKALSLSRAELAPAFMEAFGHYEKETEGSFIAFCRLVDPSIPAERDLYRNDPSYQAATYLRRLVQQTETTKKTGKRKGPKPATPLVALARFVATVLPVVDPTGAIWAAFVAEMHWSERQAARVQALGLKAGPVPVPKKVQSILEHKRAVA